jgi:hypothetical protein
VIDTLDIEVFRLFIGAADGKELERANFGEYEDKAGIKMAADTGRLPIFFPVIFDGCLSEILCQDIEVRAGDVGRKALFVEDRFGACDVGKKAARGETVCTNGGFPRTDDVGQVEAVGFEECFAEQSAGDFKADVTEIGGGSEATFTELVYVEGELGLDVSMGVLGVVDGRAESLLE